MLHWIVNEVPETLSVCSIHHEELSDCCVGQERVSGKNVRRIKNCFHMFASGTTPINWLMRRSGADVLRQTCDPCARKISAAFDGRATVKYDTGGPIHLTYACIELAVGRPTGCWITFTIVTATVFVDGRTWTNKRPQRIHTDKPLRRKKRSWCSRGFTDHGSTPREDSFVVFQRYDTTMLGVQWSLHETCGLLPLLPTSWLSQVYCSLFLQSIISTSYWKCSEVGCNVPLLTRNS